jgi:hypothetical protein
VEPTRRISACAHDTLVVEMDIRWLLAADPRDFTVEGINGTSA